MSFESALHESCFSSREKLLSRIFFRLLPCDPVKYSGRPFHRVLDLVLLYSCYLCASESGMYSVPLDCRTAAAYELDEDALYAAALGNTPRFFKPQLQPMSAVMHRLSGADPDEPCDMQEQVFVLTNDRQIHGAGVICYPGVLEHFYDSLARLVPHAGGLFVLPSSIHETLLLPAEPAQLSNPTEQQRLSSMVSEINRTVVSPAERLCDHCYIYIPGEGLRLPFGI